MKVTLVDFFLLIHLCLYTFTHMTIFINMQVYMGRAFQPKASFNHLLSGTLKGVLFIVSAVHSLFFVFFLFFFCFVLFCFVCFFCLFFIFLNFKIFNSYMHSLSYLSPFMYPITITSIIISP